MSNYVKSSRFICLLLCLLLSVCIFSGCKKDDAASSSKDQSAVTTSMENTELVDQYKDKKHPTLPETKDLGGFEMLYASSNVKAILPEEGSSVEGDLILETLRITQDTYNCKINVVEVAYDGWGEAQAAILSGEQYANVIMPCVWQSGAFLQSRLCADYLTTEISQYIDMSQPWWNDTMAYASNVLGSVYAGASAIESPADYTYVIFFNKSIAADIGLGETELYDLWEKNEWNWDNFVKFAKLANKDLDGNGAVDTTNDRWGFVCPGYDCAQAFCSSAVVASVTTDDGMNPVYTFNTPHAITTLTKLNQLFTTDGIYCQESWNNELGTYEVMFKEGRALFYGRNLMRIYGTTFRGMEFDWGVLPIPIGPSENGGWQQKYMSRVDHNFRLCIIPSTVEDKASTALVLEHMTYEYYKIINEKIDTAATLYCRDDESVDVCNTIYNTSTFEISQFLYSINNMGWNNSVETRIRDIVKTPAYDVSGAVNAPAELAQQMINDYFNGV
ncbi:MAG: extracellular solute-binding protein [Clostridia bacterium]|nr:extracellular solute-binding protein [Clostridia bacterium]